MKFALSTLYKKMMHAMRWGGRGEHNYKVLNAAATI